MYLLKKTIIAMTVIVSTLSANCIWAKDLDVNLNFSPVEEMGDHATLLKGSDGKPAVEVVGSDTETSTELIVCAAPEFSTNEYVVRGQVMYEGVVGDGYLELLNDFGNKRIFFTRTLSQFGRQKNLQGTSDWREFELPFSADLGMKPIKLTLNLVLPGRGKVTVSQPRFVNIAHSAGAWWTNQQGGRIGGIAGCLLGVLGGLIGLSAAWGKSRNVTMGLCSIGMAIGVGSLLIGVVAAVLKQPYHVYYPLLLIGGISVCAIGANLRGIAQRFQADEFRRIQAVDAT
jgi:hypothetical protein